MQRFTRLTPLRVLLHENYHKASWFGTALQPPQPLPTGVTLCRARGRSPAASTHKPNPVQLCGSDWRPIWRRRGKIQSTCAATQNVHTGVHYVFLRSSLKIPTQPHAHHGTPCACTDHPPCDCMHQMIWTVLLSILFGANHIKQQHQTLTQRACIAFSAAQKLNPGEP